MQQIQEIELSEKIKIDWKHKLKHTDFAEGGSALSCLKNNTGGIYLWVREKDGAIWYVGETSEFLSRFKDHFVNQIGGRYWVFDLEMNNRNWPGEESYEPSQPAIFEDIADKERRLNRFKKSFQMLEKSYFLFGEMKGASKECREEAEGSILRFFYDNYYKQEMAKEYHLIGKVKRNPTGKYSFEHNNQWGHLNQTRKFYSQDNDFPLK